MSDYTDAVEHQLKGIEAVSINSDDHDDFSWSQCDGCGSTFGGARYGASGLIPRVGATIADGADTITLSVCVDCVMFLANGEEPDEWVQHPWERKA